MLASIYDSWLSHLFLSWSNNGKVNGDFLIFIYVICFLALCCKEELALLPSFIHSNSYGLIDYYYISVLSSWLKLNPIVNLFWCSNCCRINQRKFLSNLLLCAFKYFLSTSGTRIWHLASVCVLLYSNEFLTYKKY